MIYDRIKELCKRQGIPVYKLEAELGMSSGSISKWNTSDPAARSLFLVAKRLNTSVEDLLQ